MSVPPFFDHTARGAVFGAMVGGGIAALGWVVRQRNATVIDLEVPAPRILAEHRALAEALLYFKHVSHHNDTTRSLYAQVVKDCEFVVGQQGCKGGAQVLLQKRITQAVACAKRLCHEAFRHRDPSAHDCRMQIEVLEGHLGSVQKNTMLD